MAKVLNMMYEKSGDKEQIRSFFFKNKLNLPFSQMKNLIQQDNLFKEIAEGLEGSEATDVIVKLLENGE